MFVVAEQFTDTHFEHLPNLDSAITSPKISMEAVINSSNSEVGKRTSYEERRKALLRIHNVDNEAAKVRMMREKGLSKAERKQYAHDQVTNQVAEHAIGVPYNELTILAKSDGRFTMYGMEILQMYKETAEMTSPGSQQWSEFYAYKNLYDRIREGANVAIEVSPTYDPTPDNPEPAQRSFGFLHTVGEYNPKLEATEIKLRLLRKDTEPGDMTWAIKMQQGMQYRGGLQPTPVDQIKSRLDIVESPVAFVAEDPNNIDPYLEVAGISKEDIRFSHQAKAMLKEGSTDLLRRYHEIIELLSTIENKNSINYLLNKKRAQGLIEQVFVLGSKIRDWLKGETNEHPFQHVEALQELATKGDLVFYEGMYQSNRRHSRELEIRGGYDCGTVDGEKNEATATINELIEGVLNNNPLESTTHRKIKSGGKAHESNTACAKCGVCHKVEPVRVIDGDYYCVNCQQKGPKAEAPTT